MQHNASVQPHEHDRPAIPGWTDGAAWGPGNTQIIIAGVWVDLRVSPGAVGDQFRQPRSIADGAMDLVGSARHIQLQVQKQGPLTQAGDALLSPTAEIELPIKGIGRSCQDQDSTESPAIRQTELEEP